MNSPVPGDNGGLLTVDASGNASFDPNGDFSALASGQEATTSFRIEIQDSEGRPATFVHVQT
ncbi:MAG: hypothetical protein AAFQ51_12505, partial [Pseudomonadota bacterium]